MTVVSIEDVVAAERRGENDGIVVARIGLLLLQKEHRCRGVARTSLVASMKPRPAFIWDGTHDRYFLWSSASLFGCVISTSVFGWYVSGPDGRLPGGLPYLLVLVWLLVLFAGPSLAFGRRRRELRCRKPIEATSFGAAMFNVAPAIPQEFALVVREALAAAYCVPSELIGHDDTRWRCTSLSLMSQPLAVEIIADVAARQGLAFDLERVRLAAEAFKVHRASTVAELVGLIYHAMLSAGLLDAPVEKKTERGEASN